MIRDWSFTGSESRMFCSRNLIAYSSLLTGDADGDAAPAVVRRVLLAAACWSSGKSSSRGVVPFGPPTIE